VLIGVTGLAGAGKTTTINYLAERLPGRLVYVGQFIQDEVKQRGLELTAANEKRIRGEVRNAEGDAAFASRAIPHISTVLETSAALIDAIYVKAEWDLYGATFHQQTRLLKIDTSFEVRVARLADRPERSLTRAELADRDTFELEHLRLDEVFQIADVVISNEGTRAELERRLEELISTLRG
jgi:dephospho-CoA kinase